jgi:hypothetical protein
MAEIGRRLHLLRLAMADAGWVGLALLTWNVRKTRFRLGGGRCPCQNPGDTGRAGETRCEPAQFLHVPARFRVVCPLLKATPQGWLCSVDQAQVRPFWVRAFSLAMALVLFIWLGAATALWVGSLSLGYQHLGPADFAWPGRWPRLRVAQGEAFRAQALRAIANDDFQTGLLALSTAYARQPRLEDGLLLAVLYARAGNRSGSDRLFGDLLTRFPGQRARVAWIFHDHLLLAGRTEALALLALREIAAGTATTSDWWRALAFATARLHGPGAFWAEGEKLLAGRPKVERQLLIAMQLHAASQTDAAVVKLREITATDADQAAWIVGLPLDWNRPQEAAEIFRLQRARLASFDAALLSYAINHAGGRAVAASSYWSAMLSDSAVRARFDGLCARLIMDPDPSASASLLRFVRGLDPLPPEQLAALWVVASREGDQMATAALAAQLGPAAGVPPIVWDWSTLRELTLALPLPRQTLRALVAQAMALSAADLPAGAVGSDSPGSPFPPSRP